MPNPINPPARAGSIPAARASSRATATSRSRRCTRSGGPRRRVPLPAGAVADDGGGDAQPGARAAGAAGAASRLRLAARSAARSAAARSCSPSPPGWRRWLLAVLAGSRRAPRGHRVGFVHRGLHSCSSSASSSATAARPASRATARALLRAPGFRWADSDEQGESIALSAIFVVLGIVLIVLGIVADSRTFTGRLDWRTRR